MALWNRSEHEWDQLVEEALRFLRQQARLRRTTSYTEMNAVLESRTGLRSFDFSKDSDRAAMGELLGRVVDAELVETDLVISAIVIYLNENDAGSGFYNLAIEKGRLPASAPKREREQFWTAEVAAVHNRYARHQRRAGERS